MKTVSQASGEAKAKVCPADALRAQATALRAQASALDALADSLPSNSDDPDPLLDADQTLETFGVGRDALKSAADRNEIAISRGARGKLLVRRSEVEGVVP